MSTTLRDAIAEIRAAALQSATLGGNWYLPGDMARLLPPEDGALLIACEPVRLCAVLDAAEEALRPRAEAHTPPGYHVTVGRGGVLLSCVDLAGKIAKTQAFTSGNVDRDYLDAVEDGEAFLASLRGAEEINGASTASSEEGQADGDRLAGVGPAHVLSGVLTLFRDEAGVLRSTVGVDVTAMCGRPRDEFIRADHCPDNRSARCSHFVLNALGFLQPGSEAVWQEMTVSHDGLDASVVDLVIPGYSDYVRQA